jgi:hypothetical protein
MEPVTYAAWPRGLKGALLGIAFATVIVLVQDARLVLGPRPIEIWTVAYAAASTAIYLAGVVLGLMGRRRAFFWNGLAIAALHIAFVIWYAVFVVGVMFEIQVFFLPFGRTLVWNGVLFVLALTLGSYLLAKERPRLLALGTRTAA